MIKLVGIDGRSTNPAAELEVMNWLRLLSPHFVWTRQIKLNVEFASLVRCWARNSTPYLIRLPRKTQRNLAQGFCHELIHIEQYHLNLLGWDYERGINTWLGKPFNRRSVKYLDRPWEQQARAGEVPLARWLKDQDNPFLKLELQSRKQRQLELFERYG